MKSEEEFQHFFSTRLQPSLNPMEEYRIAKVRKFRNCMYLALLCSLFIVLSIIFVPQPIFIIASFFPMAFFLGLAYQTYLEMSDHLTKQFKNKILPQLLSFLFNEFEYIANQKIAKSVLEKSKLFPRYFETAKGEDFMRFKLGETMIMFCETTAINNNGNVIFKGIFISSSFNKQFASETFILPASILSSYGRIKKQFLDHLQRIKLEDIEFSKEFTVLSTDQVESRYILTPSLMQRLLDYKRKTKKKISFSFVDNHLYCAIPNYTDLFEPALFEPFNLYFIKKSYNPIKLYTDLVEDLNLNLRIWTKQ